MNNSLPASDGGISPKEWYQGLSAQNGFVHDTAQSDAIDQMDILWHQLLEFKSRRNRFLGRSRVAVQRYYLRACFYRIQVVRPVLHHALAFG